MIMTAPRPQSETPQVRDRLEKAEAVFGRELESCNPVGSEPLRLLGEIEARWGQPALCDDRWSVRQTVLFCLVSCGSFWALALYGLVSLTR